jgi:Ion channel
MKKESNLIRFVQTHRSGLIVCVLVAEMVISPVADYHPHLGAVVAGSVWLLIIVAARYMAAYRLVRWVVLPIAGLWAVARLLEAFGNQGHVYSRLAPVLGLALSCTLLWGIMERAHQVRRSPGTAVAEALIAYLLIAIAFAQLYWILNQTLAKPFNQVIPPYEISTLLYFSMVTISSVGYGGIAPLNPYVRMVAAFEGIAGIFYIAVVVARLVASYGGSEPRPQE